MEPLILSLLALIIPLGAKQPNILWVVTDDQRADSLACFNQAVDGRPESALGYVSSPALDQLASEDILFTRAYCNSPGYVPSRLYGASRGRNSTHGPTKTHRRQYEIAAERFAEVHPKLQNLTGKELEKLYEQLEKAGVPWTAGRPVPILKK